MNKSKWFILKNPIFEMNKCKLFILKNPTHRVGWGHPITGVSYILPITRVGLPKGIFGFSIDRPGWCHPMTRGRWDLHLVGNNLAFMP